MKLSRAIAQVDSGRRIGFKAAETLYREADLLLLGQLAHSVRMRLNPESKVTYAVDRNINYTNVCVSSCRFCAFWRPKDSPDAYVLDRDQLAQKIEETKALGGTHILFQGGHHPDLDLEWHLSTVRFIRSLGMGIHGYSPPEIIYFAQRAGLSVEAVIARFIEAGLGSIPGGGAEILVDRVRRRVAPGKAASRDWLAVMAAAHKLGLKTTATMMFGHLETLKERLAHLFRLRRLQDETGGFTAFIPWPFQPENTGIPLRPAGGTDYLRTLAVARLVLDNFPHLQASWVTQGPHLGQVALRFGADDLGSTMIEENVVAAAGVSHRLSEAEMIRLINEAGFTANQRDVYYNPVERDK